MEKSKWTIANKMDENVANVRVICFALVLDKCTACSPLLPSLSPLLCEPMTLFDHTEALHQQGHGCTFTLSATPASVL